MHGVLAVVPAPAYPRAAARFLKPQRGVHCPGLHPTPKGDIGLHAARLFDARHEKARGHDARGGEISQGFSEADGLRNIHSATADFSEHNDISRETAITPAQCKSQSGGGRMVYLWRTESLLRRNRTAPMNYSPPPLRIPKLSALSFPGLTGVAAPWQPPRPLLCNAPS